MKPDMLGIIVCPLCKKELQLITKEQNKKEIVAGSLFCSTCKNTYPISDTIPDLLPRKDSS
jgi:uncharacterized protein YbaR (Trm112 family)